MRNDMDRVLVTRPRFSWLWARSTFVVQIRNPSLREESAACGIGGDGDGGMAPNTARTNPRAGASTRTPGPGIVRERAEGSGILGVAHPVFGQADDDYIYCTRTGGERYATWNTYYYTSVFLGDYSLTQGHENDFYDYLKDNAPEMYFVHSYCFSAGTRNEAEERLLHHIRQDERNGYRVVRTNWTARASGSRTGGSFAASPIQDFRVSVPASPYEVEVCVRDHECEDGDQVRVSVNGSAPLGGEIFNEWNCRSISLREGRHDIELYAVNGTGYKGNCSHIDGNTELRVTGEDSQTQSWRHRGGKGSKANIEVTVRWPRRTGSRMRTRLTIRRGADRRTEPTQTGNPGWPLFDSRSVNLWQVPQAPPPFAHQITPCPSPCRVGVPDPAANDTSPRLHLLASL